MTGLIQQDKIIMCNKYESWDIPFKCALLNILVFSNYSGRVD